MLSISLSHEALWVGLIAFFAGAIHVLAPDHWVPTSILSWQRGWRKSATAIFAGSAWLGHLLIGFLIFLALSGWLGALDSRKLFIASLLIVFVGGGIRSFRFSRRRELLRIGPHRLWGIVTVISLLGPCESIVPVFLKAHQLGIGYLNPLLAFFGGTLFSGLLLVLGARAMWNRPLWLSRGLVWVHGQATVLPVLAGVGIGLTYLLKIAS